MVQLSHGIGEHIGRYGELIEALNAAGYSVWADDHRGHGQTGFEQHGGDLDRMGEPGPGGMRAAIAALEQFTEVIRDAEGSDIPLVILGHSWGSFMTQHVVNRHPENYEAVVLTGTAWLQLGHTNIGDLNKRFARPGGTNVEWLSRDPAVAEAWEADPYTTDRTLQQLFGWPRRSRSSPGPPSASRASCRCSSWWGPTIRSRASPARRVCCTTTSAACGLVDATLIVYEGARHEVFNEINQEEVRGDLIRWLDERFAVD